MSDMYPELNSHRVPPPRRDARVFSLKITAMHDSKYPLPRLFNPCFVQLGRTRTIPLSLEPVWADPEERFVLAVGFEDAAKCDITLQVWDEDALGEGDFLGQVKVQQGNRGGIDCVQLNIFDITLDITR